MIKINEFNDYLLYRAQARMMLADRIEANEPYLTDMLKDIYSDCHKITEYIEILPELKDEDLIKEWFISECDRQGCLPWGIVYLINQKQNKINNNDGSTTSH